MWVATINFTKAFDSITHNSIWNALKTCGMDQNQKATVLTDKESDMFEIKKETK